MKNNQRDAKWNWSLTISCLSFLLSLTALWYSAISPADIKADASSLLFLWRENTEHSTSQPSDQGKPKLIINATCSFSNNGARIGTISYMALRFESDDGTKWLFAPTWIADSGKLMEDGFAKRTWIKGHFNSILVPGKQTIVQSYMFYSESGLQNFSDANLSAHKFHVTLLTWTPGDDKPQEQQTGTIDLDENAIQNIKDGVMQGLPFVEQQKQVQALK